MVDGVGDRTAFLAACVQLRSGLDRQKNVAVALELIEDAAGRGAKLILTPEMTNVVDRNAARLGEKMPAGEAIEEVRQFAAAAARHGVHLIIGSMAIKRADGKFANRCFVYGPDGAVAARYDKIHMFDVDLANGESWRESRIYEAGSEIVVVETPLISAGLSICYDLRFPHLYRTLAQAGAGLLCVPAAFTRQTGKAHWTSLLRARAIECGAFVMAAAQGGFHEDGRETFGHSMIISPWGDILSEAPGDEPGVILAEIDPALVSKARSQIPSLRLENSAKVLNVRV